MKIKFQKTEHERGARSSPRSRRGGFSYLELMVTITVFSLMSVSFLANYNKINGKIAVDTDAERIGQAIREAQVYALGSRGIHASGPSEVVFPGFGLYIDPSTPDSFILFSDNNNHGVGNNKYDAAGGCGNNNTECLYKIKLGKNITLKPLCGATALGGQSVGCPAGTKQAQNFTIMFRGPSTDATMTGDTVGPPNNNDAPYSSAIISIASKSGFTRSVTLYPTAQVVIK